MVSATNFPMVHTVSCSMTLQKLSLTQTCSTSTTSKNLATAENQLQTTLRIQTPRMTRSSSSTSSSIQNRSTRRLSYSNISKVTSTEIKSSNHLNLTLQKKICLKDHIPINHSATLRNGNVLRRLSSSGTRTKWYRCSSRTSPSWSSAQEAATSLL